jgi:hypothetical protein
VPHPTAYNAERHRVVVAALAEGATYETAAGAARVSRRSVLRWLEKGERELVSVEEGAEPISSEVPFMEFYLDAHKALADVELELLAEVRSSLPGKLKTHACWVLERRFGWVAVQRQELALAHEENVDPAAVFGTDDPIEQMRRANELAWPSG